MLKQRAGWIVAGITAGILLALGLSGGFLLGPRFQNPDITGALYGSEFELLDTEGRVRHLSDFRGKAVFLFFGFASCPDVCPTTLIRAKEVKTLLGPRGKQLQLLFVTLDPERDKPDFLRKFADFFDPDIVALYTTPENTPALAKAFHIVYDKIVTGSSYTIDHSAISYIYDPQGRLRLMVPHQSTAESITADINLLFDSPEKTP